MEQINAYFFSDNNMKCQAMIPFAAHGEKESVRRKKRPSWRETGIGKKKHLHTTEPCPVVVYGSCCDQAVTRVASTNWTLHVAAHSSTQDSFKSLRTCRCKLDIVVWTWWTAPSTQTVQASIDRNVIRALQMIFGGLLKVTRLWCLVLRTE